MPLGALISRLLSAFRAVRQGIAAGMLWQYKRRGLQVGENFTCVGVPRFGASPHMVTIGNNVSISGDVTFITHDATPWHLQKIGRYDKSTRSGRIVVHDDCGIGHGALILPGVSIGPRSIVGAGAVVRKDVPPDSVVVGNPARVAMTLEEYIRFLRRTDPDSAPETSNGQQPTGRVSTGLP